MWFKELSRQLSVLLLLKDCKVQVNAQILDLHFEQAAEMFTLNGQRYAPSNPGDLGHVVPRERVQVHVGLLKIRYASLTTTREPQL